MNSVNENKIISFDLRRVVPYDIYGQRTDRGAIYIQIQVSNIHDIRSII
jgi:hypothetical protein